MHSGVFFGGSVVAAVLAGGVSLFAPCCISVMLPAYFSSAFQNRRRLIAMTFLFAAGIATVILPIALGAAALARFITAQHELLYVGAGVALLGLAAFTLAGGRLHLPTPARGGSGAGGPWSVYTLGVFSGMTTSCCAPVLAGVLALSGVAASFGAALGLGLAYVFGMVAPLFVISLLWERLGERGARLLRPRRVRVRVGPWGRELSAATLVSGVLLALMGAGMLYVGLESNTMPSPSSWEAAVSDHLQHYGSVLTHAFSFVPGAVAAVVLVIALALLARRALRQVTTGSVPLDGQGRAQQEPQVDPPPSEDVYENGSRSRPFDEPLPAASLSSGERRRVSS